MNDSKKRYAILIASSNFQDTPNLPNLHCPENDVHGLEKLLLSEDYEMNILINKSWLCVRNKIFETLNQAKKDDFVLIYYSGHGKLNRDGKLHLAMNDTIIEKLLITSISLGDIKHYITQSESQKIILILDCCYSGAAGLDFINKGSIEDQLQIESTGLYLMTASTGVQTANEAGPYSIFTKYIIEGIESGEADLNNDGFIQVDEMYAYVYQKMKEEGVKQTPKFFQVDTKGISLVISHSKGISFDSTIMRLYNNADNDVFIIIQNRINTTKTNSDESFFLNFFAIAGFGKRTFLELLRKQLQTLDSEVSSSHIILLLTEFDNIDRLLNEIIKQIKRKSPSLLINNLNGIALQKKLIDTINAANDCFFIFLFDDYDRMPPSGRDIFESDIFGELIKTKRALIIFTSTRAIIFENRLYLKMHLEKHPMLAFEQETIEKAFPELEQCLSDIHMITGGMPIPTAKLIERIEQNTLSKKVIESYYREYVFHLLQKIQPEYRQKIALALSCLRQFNVGLLKAILPNISPERYAPDAKPRDYFNIIEDFQNEGRVYWRDTNDGFALHGALRILFQGYALFEEPKLYQDVHQCAFEYYKQVLEIGYREQYYIECLYHAIRSKLWEKQREEFPETAKTDQDFLDEFEREFANITIENPDALLHNLNNDSEIQAAFPDHLLESLKDYIK